MIAQASPAARGERGQTTVELALCLPLVALFLLTVVQAGLIVADQTRLWYGAREAARVAVVDPDPAAITQAAERSGLARVDVSVQPQPAVRSEGRPLTVALTYRPRSIIPMLGGLVGSIELHANATMRIEQP